LVLAAVWHLIGKFHVVVNCLVDLYVLLGWNYIIGRLKTHSLDAIAVVHGKFRVVLGLNSFIDDAINDTKGVKVELNALMGAVSNLEVLFVEMIEELWVLEFERNLNYTGSRLTAGP
jgi:hypothetical protein